MLARALHYLMGPTPAQRRGGTRGLDLVAQDNPAGSLDAIRATVHAGCTLQWSWAELGNPDGPGVGRHGLTTHLRGDQLARPRGVTPQGSPGWTRTNRRLRIPGCRT